MRTRALVVSPTLAREDALRSPEARREEAAGLARAIDLEVAGAESVSLNAVRPATFIGKGKVEELAARVNDRTTPAGKAQRTEIQMATEKAQNLQDTFLNHVRKSKTSVTIFLVNGVKLQGFVTWFDNFCVLLRRDGHSQLVYKHAISTIMPASPITMFEAVDEDAR